MRDNIDLLSSLAGNVEEDSPLAAVVEESLWKRALEASPLASVPGVRFMLRAELVDDSAVQVVGYAGDGLPADHWSTSATHTVMEGQRRRPIWIPVLHEGIDPDEAMACLRDQGPWSNGLAGIVLVAGNGGNPRFLNRDEAGTWSEIPSRFFDLAATQFSRNEGILETDLLMDRTVLLIGLGSLGGPAAEQLARAGVGTLLLVDHDRVDPENLSRQIFTVRDIGRRKVDAVAEKLVRINPRITAEPIRLDILADFDRGAVLTSRADIALVGVDREAPRSFMNEVALETGTPVIFAEAYHRALGGQFLRVVPGQTPCRQCALGRLSEALGDAPIVEKGGPAYMSEDPNASKPWPGLGIDTGLLSFIFAKFALVTLLRSLDPSVQDFPADFLVWGNNPEWIFPQPLFGQFATTEYLLNCPMCAHRRTPEQEEAARAQAEAPAHVQETVAS